MAKKYWIKTFGCQMNKSDSERIVEFLKKRGFTPCSKLERADWAIVNMCSVRQSAVDRVFGLQPKIKKLRQKNPKGKIILTGCVLKRDRKKFLEIFDYVLDNKKLSSWPIPTPTKISKVKNSRVKPSTMRIGYVPISFGCNNFCTYCVVPYTRGRLAARPVEEIIKNVKKLVKEGKKEIWLLGQNVNDYRYKLKTRAKKPKLINFAKLLKLINAIPGDFKLYFTSPHPKNFSQELIKTMAQSKKFSRELNLPLQSGDNTILKKMNRNYTVQEYKKLVKKIRRAIPEIKLSTDAIVGFPGETKKQFENTAKLFQEIGFDKAYVAQYSPRPGTAAEHFVDNVPKQEKKRREKILEEIIKEKKKRKKLVVILGPTASGKTELALNLAKKFKGEIVSGDSRQIYSEMISGTASPCQKYQISNIKYQNDKLKFKILIKRIPHHLFHIIPPRRNFSVAEYQQLAVKTIEDIQKRGRLPFLVGGSAFYIYSVVEGWQFPKTKSNPPLRKRLEKESIQNLLKMLKKLDPTRAKTIEKQNKRRLIRAIEIAREFGRVPKITKRPAFDCLLLGIQLPQPELRKRIVRRVDKMMRQGLEKEVKGLVKKYGWTKALQSIGYQEWRPYFEGKAAGEEVVKEIITHSYQFSRRQMTWFKKDPRIRWIKEKGQAEKLIVDFLN